MGRKKKRKIDIRKIYSLIIFLIALFIALKTPAIEIIDNKIANTGIVNYVDTSQTSNVSGIPTVKENKSIIESTSNNINIDKTKSMLIDSGNNKDGETIVNGLKALGISKIDYLIGTHVHEDHIGGMSYIVNSFDIGEIYLPYNETSTANYYKKLLTAIYNKGLSIEEVNVGDKFKLSSAECEIMSVQNDEPINANLASIVIELSYGNMKYLFMGDAETENEKARSWEDIDVLFLNQVLPEISIISVGKKNSYNLPKDKIIERLEKIGSVVYRTDLDGTIQLISDGNENEIKKINLSFDGNT